MNTTYTQSFEAGLTAFYSKIYALVGMGILLSALVAGAMLTIFQNQLIAILQGGRLLIFGLWAIELALVVGASNTAAKNSPMALPFFLIYSAVNGLTVSLTLAYYTRESVFTAFLSAACLFLLMALVGRFIKKDLSGFRKAIMAAMMGLMIAGLINFFLRSSGFSYLLSIVSVLLFSGIIAYDNQHIKQVYQHTAGQVQDGWVVSMALKLYLDFINLFLNLLRLFGDRDQFGLRFTWPQTFNGWFDDLIIFQQSEKPAYW